VIWFFAETADFEVTVTASRGIAVFGPGVETKSGEKAAPDRNLVRDFAIIAARVCAPNVAP